MKEKLAKYIEDNYEELSPRIVEFKLSRFKSKEKYDSYVMEDMCGAEASINNISDYINHYKVENKFQTLLFKYIDDRNLSDSDVYNKVHIDRRLFSKIRNDVDYHPSKETIILLALSLKLSVNELLDLLESASYSLPKNNYFDLIIRFCFIEKIYDLKDVNDLLALYNCKMFNY